MSWFVYSLFSNDTRNHGFIQPLLLLPIPSEGSTVPRRTQCPIASVSGTETPYT